MICWQDCSVSLQSYSKSYSVIAAMCCICIKIKICLLARRRQAIHLFQTNDKVACNGCIYCQSFASSSLSLSLHWLHLLWTLRIIVLAKTSFVQACATICDQDFAQIALMISRLYCPLSAMLLHKYSTCVDSAFFERTFLEDFGQFTDNSVQKVLLHQLDHPVM